MIWLYVLSVLTSFGGVFVRVFQQQNIQGRHYKWAFATSYVYAAFDVATIGFIVQGGWSIALSTGTGAAFGVITGMYMHGKVVKSRVE